MGNKPFPSSKVFEVVENTEFPIDPDHVAGKLSINWATAQRILLELVIERKISGCRTTKGWIFWRKGLNPESLPVKKEEAKYA